MINQDKDYKGETDFVKALFRRYSTGPVVKILEGGCGTGGHALPLARRGYQVNGIDAYGEMVGLVRDKANKAGLDIGFHTADLRHFDLAVYTWNNFCKNVSTEIQGCFDGMA